MITTIPLHHAVVCSSGQDDEQLIYFFTIIKKSLKTSKNIIKAENKTSDVNLYFNNPAKEKNNYKPGLP